VLSFACLKEALGEVPSREVEQSLTEIAREILSGEADFLLGSGMSADAGLPTGAQLLRKLLRRHLFVDVTEVSDDDLLDLAASAPFEVIMGVIQEDLPRKRVALREELIALLTPSPAGTSSDAHTALAQLILWNGSILIRRIFTTNLELLFEEAIGEAAMPITEENADQYEQALRGGRIPVLHLHGLVGSDFQVTEDDVMDATTYRSLDAILMDRLFFSHAFCFVGYSLSDPDFRRLYAAYRGRLQLRKDRDKWTYVVHPVSNAAEYRLFQSAWTIRGAKFIPLTSNEFFSQIGELMTVVRDQRDADDLCQYYGWSPTDLAVRVRKVRDILDLQEDPDAYEFLREIGPVKVGGAS